MQSSPHATLRPTGVQCGVPLAVASSQFLPSQPPFSAWFSPTTSTPKTPTCHLTHPVANRTYSNIMHPDLDHSTSPSWHRPSFSRLSSACFAGVVDQWSNRPPHHSCSTALLLEHCLSPTRGGGGAERGARLVVVCESPFSLRSLLPTLRRGHSHHRAATDSRHHGSGIIFQSGTQRWPPMMWPSRRVFTLRPWLCLSSRGRL